MMIHGCDDVISYNARPMRSRSKEVPQHAVMALVASYRAFTAKYCVFDSSRPLHGSDSSLARCIRQHQIIVSKPQQ
ncbi:hypothetical protein Ddc_15268 [Ditylenchus destructor]|nr:hypothetical protein Ddc_15268 [Ditylenchus destructor]